MVKEGAIPEQAIFKGTDEEYRALAKGFFHDEGVIEIDDNARIAKGAECGAYVEAWVWVDNPNWDDDSEERPPSQDRGGEKATEETIKREQHLREKIDKHLKQE